MEQFISSLLQLFEFTHLLYLFGGTLLGLTVGILPGLGGTSGLALVLPFVFNLQPSYALAMMIGVLAPTTTSDTFPAILMGIPGTAGSQATVMDGFPLSKAGEAARALSAAFFSSLLGGIFGAFVLSISIYYAIPIIMSFGFGEQFLLIILALLMVGALAGDNFIKGITACFLGLIIGSIGTAPITGDPRFTFNTLYLIEGVPLVVVGMGLFAIPEIVGLLDSKGAIAKSLNIENTISAINNKKPSVINILIILGLGFLPITASIVKNSRCPPSKTGIGNKFIIPIAVDKTAINQR